MHVFMIPFPMVVMVFRPRRSASRAGAHDAFPRS